MKYPQNAPNMQTKCLLGIISESTPPLKTYCGDPLQQVRFTRVQYFSPMIAAAADAPNWPDYYFTRQFNDSYNLHPPPIMADLQHWPMRTAPVNTAAPQRPRATTRFPPRFPTRIARPRRNPTTPRQPFIWLTTRSPNRAPRGRVSRIRQ